MQQLITGLLLVIYILLNMFQATSCPSSGAYQLQQQQQLLIYCWNVVVAVLLVMVDHDQQHYYHHIPTVNQRLLLQLLSS
jgi:hypothetical protein